MNPTNIASLLQKATQKIKNSEVIEQNAVWTLCPSLFTVASASFAFHNNRIFSVLGHSTPWYYIKF